MQRQLNNKIQPYVSYQSLMMFKSIIISKQSTNFVIVKTSSEDSYVKLFFLYNFHRRRIPHNIIIDYEVTSFYSRLEII